MVVYCDSRADGSAGVAAALAHGFIQWRKRDPALALSGHDHPRRMARLPLLCNGAQADGMDPAGRVGGMLSADRVAMSAYSGT